MTHEEQVLVDEANRLAAQVSEFPQGTPIAKFQHLEDAWAGIVAKLINDFNWNDDMLCNHVTVPE